MIVSLVLAVAGYVAWLHFICFYSKNYARAAHRRHEEGGHGPEIERMGPLNYLPTYLWHGIVLHRSWAAHEMEREAVERESHLPLHLWINIGTPPTGPA